MGVWQSGQMRGTVNPLPYGYSGSNPLAPTIYGVIGEVINTPDCGSGMHRFDSYMAPHIIMPVSRLLSFKACCGEFESLCRHLFKEVLESWEESHNPPDISHFHIKESG